MGQDSHPGSQPGARSATVRGGRPCEGRDKVRRAPAPAPFRGSFDVKRYNNLAQRNIAIADSDNSDSDLAAAVVAGTIDPVGVDAVVIDRTLVPTDHRVFVRADDERVMARWLDLVRSGAVRGAEPLPGSRPGAPAPAPAHPVPDDPDIGHDGDCRVVLLDPARLAISCYEGDVLVVHAPRRTALEFRHGTTARPRPRASLGKVQGQDVVFLDAGGADAMELPLRLSGGQYMPMVLGLSRPGGLRGAASLLATQRRGNGELSAGYTIEG